MRDYAKVSPQFWIGETGREIKKLGLEAQLIALYLITNPHANMLGIYYLPLTLIAHETGLTLEGASKGLSRLCDARFCSYDDHLEYVWVHQMAFFQVDAPLKPNDNRVKAINDSYHALPNLTFLKAFYDKYHEALCLEKARDYLCSMQAPSKSLRSQEQEQEQEQDQEQEQEQEQKENVVARTRPYSPDGTDVIAVFEHWKQTMKHRNAVLDDKRKKLIRNALKSGYAVTQLCEAITGCSLTPHNIGDNDRGQRYDGLHVILRDADQIDRFINNARSPPKSLTQAERHTNANVQTLQNWVSKKMTEENMTHGNT